MKVAFRPDGIQVEGNAALELADAALRGIGQVMLQNNTYAGALFLVGVIAASPIAGAALLVGALVSTLAALALGVDRAQLRAGLFGFNGALVALALVVSLPLDVALAAYVVLGAAGATVAASALTRALAPAKLPALTAAFVLVTWCFLAMRAEATAAELDAPTERTLATVGAGLVRGVAQVFLQPSLAAGAVILVGLLIASRRAFVAALVGSLGGLLVAWAFGAPELALRTGLYGYNAALTAIALTTFLPQSPSTATFVAAAIAVSSVASAALSTVFASLGVPPLTAAFVLVVWACLLVAPRCRRLAPGA